MQIKKLLCLILCFVNYGVHSQTKIEVVDATFKAPALEETFQYYGFAEGDQIIVNFHEVNGKELKEFEILEYPASSKFMEYKIADINDKVINIGRTGIYKFRFNNTSLAGRVCKLKIERIPSSEATAKLNSSVFWRTVSDTTYTNVQEQFIERVDTAIITVLDQVAKVSSQNALNGNSNKNVIDFSLPDRTISWSYYIGVGTEGQKAFDQARESFLKNSAAVLSRLPGYGTMGALALHGVNYFNKVQGEDNVKYAFIKDWNNAQLFKSGSTYYLYKQGDVVNDAGVMKTPLSGKAYLGLLNDNIIEPIDVLVKVTAIQITPKVGIRTLRKMWITKREEPYLK